jgi:undecaprenyl-diphosphatase
MRWRRHWPLIGGVTAIVLVLGLGAVLTLRASPFEVDQEWMEEIVEHRNNFWTVPSLVMSFLGGGWFSVFVVPIGGAIAFLIAKRPWDAFYFILATAVSAGLVQLLKAVFARARPEDILDIVVDPGSFPSGHVANAATVAVALGLIFRRTWVWVVGVLWIIVMALSRTYLGAHWVSDTVGGALLGAGVAVLLWIPFARRRERAAESVA